MLSSSLRNVEILVGVHKRFPKEVLGEVCYVTVTHVGKVDENIRQGVTIASSGLFSKISMATQHVTSIRRQIKGSALRHEPRLILTTGRRSLKILRS